ncbi:hypothetical protein ACQP3L_39265, partial [Escherichia coli]
TQRSVCSQPSSEQLPSTAEGSKYRDPQSNIMKRVRDLGTLSRKWDVFIKPLPSGLKRAMQGEEDEGI